MHPKKLEFADAVVHTVRDICGQIFNITSNEQLGNMFGLSNGEMVTVIRKIINALPEKIFNGTHTQKLEEIKHICAREFIFFQVQEKGHDAQYETDLLNFIWIFSRDIQERI